MNEFGLSDLSSQYVVSQTVYYDKGANELDENLVTKITEVTTISPVHSGDSIVIVRVMTNVKRHKEIRAAYNFKNAYENNRTNKRFDSHILINTFKKEESLELRQNLERIEEALIGERTTYRWPKNIPCGDTTVTGPKTEFKTFHLIGQLVKNFSIEELRAIFWELHGITRKVLNSILMEYYAAIELTPPSGLELGKIVEKKPSNPSYSSWGSW